MYEGSYGIGVTDGHRAAAAIARSALGEDATALERLEAENKAVRGQTLEACAQWLERNGHDAIAVEIRNLQPGEDKT
jgi:hypothetical protein